MTSIATDRDVHDRYCTQADDASADPGDVRRCPHGRLMVAYTVLGLAACQWWTLSPVWTPVLWWRARRALSS